MIVAVMLLVVLVALLIPGYLMVVAGANRQVANGVLLSLLGVMLFILLLASSSFDAGF